MIALLDTDYSGTMGFPEFQNLLRSIEMWKVRAGVAPSPLFTSPTV